MPVKNVKSQRERNRESYEKNKDKYYTFVVRLDRVMDEQIIKEMKDNGSSSGFARKCMRYYLWAEHADPKVKEFTDQYFTESPKLGRPFEKARSMDKPLSGEEAASQSIDANIQVTIRGKLVRVMWDHDSWAATSEDVPGVIVRGNSVDNAIRKFAEALKKLDELKVTF